MEAGLQVSLTLDWFCPLHSKSLDLVLVIDDKYTSHGK